MNKYHYPKIDILVPSGRFQALREIVPDNLEDEIKIYSIYESDKRESAIEFAQKNYCPYVYDSEGEIGTWYNPHFHWVVPM